MKALIYALAFAALDVGHQHLSTRYEILIGVLLLCGVIAAGINWCLTLPVKEEWEGNAPIQK